MNKIEIYDTTLRDGTQSPDVNLTLHDKIEFVKSLDEFGVDYIELGWPGSNLKDMETFLKVSELDLKNSKISAFGSTRRKNIKAEEDSNLKAIIESKAKVSSIFGKSWDDHVIKQLKCSLDDNLISIEESIRFLTDKGIEVFFDAEHFFDGFKNNKEYALKTLKAAYDGGAKCLVLCDTNGGTSVRDTDMILDEVNLFLKSEKLNIGLGVHIHNDSGLAVSNSIISVDKGVKHIQGTLNGFGERCGNADLCQIIPNLMIKKQYETNVKLSSLKSISDLAYTLSNNKPIRNQPFVGDNSFAHKGGIHVDAISKGASYEHIDPSLVGNKRSIILSDLSGKANIIEVLKGFNLDDIDKNDKRIVDMLKKVENMEKKGYDIGDIDAEKFLLMKQFFDSDKDFFILDSWRIISSYEKGIEKSDCLVIGSINGKKCEVVAPILGGPVDAAYNAMKKFLATSYKNLDCIHLVNYKVRIAEDKGESSTVRVFIEFACGNRSFATVGVNSNILVASFEAIEKAFKYYLFQEHDQYL
ncbi:citramalate synthase [Candidatus Woesearchaeota archaeon]|nr:MAG: citramalate synthase [Candidatus Woesearchaeota archaeon]